MVSIIISSYKEAYLLQVKNNIEKNIGVAYEIIAVPNKSVMGICKAYNIGAMQAKFPYLVFMHEDVCLHTEKWGKVLIGHFTNNKSIGLIGLAGSTFKTKMLSNWYQPVINGYEPKRGKVLQHFKGTLQKPVLTEWNPNNVLVEEVVSVDGVFLATKKETWEANKFDDTLLTHFHSYDFDFSMQIGEKKKVCVVYDILLEHFSDGNYDANWFGETLKIHQKWNHQLPKIVDNTITVADIRFLENQYINQACDRLVTAKLGLTASLNLLYQSISLSYQMFSIKGFYWRVKSTVSFFLGLTKKTA